MNNLYDDYPDKELYSLYVPEKTVRTESSQQNQAERMRTKKLNSTTDMSMM